MTLDKTHTPKPTIMDGLANATAPAPPTPEDFEAQARAAIEKCEKDIERRKVQIDVWRGEIAKDRDTIKRWKRMLPRQRKTKTD